MATGNKKKSFWGTFEISDSDSCAKAIRNGGIAALSSAAISLAFGVMGIFTQTSDKNLNYFLDPWILVDVVLIVILAIFIFRKSRIATTLLMIHFAASKAIMWIELGQLKGGFVSIIFFLYYFTAMRGTYLWHSKYRDIPNGASG